MSRDESSTRVDGPRESLPTHHGDPYEEIGNALGRYVLVERVGAGGMGTVIRAYDPRLHREVALKRVKKGVLGTDAAERLTREAQAMAQLSHPNVVAVYDVEVIADEVVIAMEYVAGVTLDRWCGMPGRTPRAIVGAYVQAGRGLAAAHARQLVHRDFKPTNVIVGLQGTHDEASVKVMDFGLAKPFAEPEQSESAMLAFMSGASINLDRTLTRADTVVGTPRYMAPEQHVGELAGPAADQFSFCVALWETLVGKAPFDADSIDALGIVKHRGPPAWPGVVGVPARMGELLRRGLAPSPDARWPEIASLLERLDATMRPRTSRARVVFVAAAASAAIGAVVLVNRNPCRGSGERMAQSWSAERRAAVDGVLARAGDATAEDARTRVTAALDRYADAWREGARDACEARHVRGEQSDRALDLRTACLERHRAQLDVAVDQLVEDPGLVASAIDIVYALPSLHECEDVERLGEETPPPTDPELAAGVEAARAEVARASSRLAAGKWAEALVLAETIANDEVAAAYVPLRLEAELVAARALYRVGKPREAEAQLRKTLAEAIEHESDATAVASAIALTHVVGVGLMRTVEGRVHAQLAFALARRRDPGGESEVQARTTIAAVLLNAGRLLDAQAEIEAGLRLAEDVLGSDHPDTARAHGTFAWVLAARGRYADAEREYRLALEISTRVLGPDHPDVLQAREGIAGMRRAQGHLAEAEQLLRDVLAARERVLGADHPSTVACRSLLAHTWMLEGRYEAAEQGYRIGIAAMERSLGPDDPVTATHVAHLGIVLLSLGRADEARALLERAIDTYVRTLGPDHANTAGAIANLAKVLAYQGRLDEAEREYRRALPAMIAAFSEDHRDVVALRINLADAESELRRAVATLVRIQGADHPDVALARNRLAGILATRGELAEAETEYRAAFAMIETTASPKDPNLAIACFDLGDLLRKRGKLDEALPLLERATTLIDATEAPPAERATIRVGLAKALAERPSTRARALAIARETRALVADVDAAANERRELDELLARHD